MQALLRDCLRGNDVVNNRKTVKALDYSVLRLSIRMIVGDIGDAQGKISQIHRIFREMLRRADGIKGWKMGFHRLKLTCQDKKAAKSL